MDNPCKFRPLSFSWVAIHPAPKGVIQFIGGFFFGTFPTFFYRYFLEALYDAGYTVIARPFQFSWRHWPIALGLLREQAVLQVAIAEEARRLGYEDSIYQDKTRFTWIGHSLGCKYIALLEFLSNRDIAQVIRDCASEEELTRLSTAYSSIPGTASILNQPSLLLAPDISDTESAIPIPAVAQFIDHLGWGVLPTRHQTQCFIQSSNLFNLTGLISFDQDTIAGSIKDENKSVEQQENSDVLWFTRTLTAKKLVQTELPGKHLEPLGIRFGKFILALNFEKLISPIADRKLEAVTLRFLAQLASKNV